MPNSYTFDQISTLLNNIVADAQGRTADISTTPRNTSEFVTMANLALSMGTDPIMNAINQMINRTIFAYRPYNRSFRILERDNIEYGNTIRKLTPIFNDGAQNSPQYNDQPADGLSTDQWVIKRPQTLQTIFTGAEQYQIQAPTVFVDQLKSAFRGPDELSQFLAAQVGEVSNEMEQQSEQLSRMTVANYIGAKIHAEPDSVIHLLSEYNAATGLELTAETVYQPDNFPGFIKWAFARITAISELMRERSIKWHKSINGYTIVRHTPTEYQRLLVYAPAMAQIKTMVLSGLYHNNLLSLDASESVNFFQNINKPDQINVTCNYLDNDGTVNAAVVARDKIFAVLYDRDAMGVNIFNEGVYMTPVNARGKYYNTFHNVVKRWWNDTTENGVVFLLD